MLDEKNKFELIEENENTAPNEDVELRDEDIKDSDFELVDNKDYSHDQKFETKPTTFLKDSIKRFSKNKSSVVAAWILGILLIMAFLVPLIDTNDVKNPHPEQVYLEPKLFNSGTGFWDGCKSYSNIAVEEVEIDGEMKKVPNTADFVFSAVSNLKVDDHPSYTNSYSRLGKNGYLNFSKYFEDETVNVYLRTTAYPRDVDLSQSLNFSISLHNEAIDLYQRVPYRIDFVYRDSDNVEYIVPLTGDSSSEYFVDDFDFEDKTFDFNNVNETALAINPSVTSAVSAYFKISLNTNDAELNSSLLIKDVTISTDSTDEDYANMIKAPSFTEANELVGRQIKLSDGKTNYAYWTSNGNKFIFKAEVTYCSFTYDTYEAAFGKKRITTVDRDDLKYYKKKGWCHWNNWNDITETFVRDSEKCPVIKIYNEIESGGSVVTYSYDCDVVYWRFIGLSSMPRYIMGTDKAGRDMFKYVFDGLKTSLLLGIVTSAICFLFGLFWGSISGYFGGAVDLAMERFTDILGGVPWIIVMTLCIIHLGQNFLTFALALCLTGWIGTASGTRTQFYRFKGREYVLASRTLGAKDMRLIFKHILPNAMGTIITSAVLMIPSVIFSEATIAYLNLGLRGMSSLGVILSNNQGELLQHPYLLLFPSAIIALLMITFNLFGNGLRDAINPSLKGEGE